jgi:cytoskeleton protein RodZ
MSEAGASPKVEPGVTAGRLLREARQAQGLHIAALASAIKVSPRKLELLESDRLDELPDATFSRALAQTVCRSLKVDAAPILALLPRAPGSRLQVGEGLNTPFRDRPGRLVPNDWKSLGRPQVWGPVLLLLAAGAVYLLPSGWLPGGAARNRPPDGSSTDAGVSGSTAPKVAPPASEAGVAPAPRDARADAAGAAGLGEAASSVSMAIPDGATEAGVPQTVVAPGSVPASPPAPSTNEPGSRTVPIAAVPATVSSTGSSAGTPAPTAVAPPPPAAGGTAPVVATEASAGPAGATKLLQLRAARDSWIEVVDSHGQKLLSRLVRGGESVGLDGVAPLRVKIGDASGTQVVFRGQPMALAPFTRDNVARLELK